MNKKPLYINEYIGNAGVEYIFEYYESDTFEHLPQDKIKQCYAVAFNKDKIIIVNQCERPGMYGLVGGTVGSGEHPDETLIREVREESNMKILEYKPIGYQKVIDVNGTEEPIYQLRYFATVEPYGPFVSDPAGVVTEVIECCPSDYKKYFDWGDIGEAIINKAVKLRKESPSK